MITSHSVPTADWLSQAETVLEMRVAETQARLAKIQALREKYKLEEEDSE